MKRKYLILAFIGFIVLIAAMTNPNKERHKETIKSKLSSYLQQSMKDEHEKPKNEWEQTGEVLGIMLGDAIINRILDNLISTDSYVVFSTTKITWDGQTKVIGIGAFGNVYLTSKLDEALKEGLLKEE